MQIISYLPGKPAVLLGHHFASIAGAAPIIGPIAASAYGWLPVLIWIVVGGIFAGAVHDFASLAASLRHRGRSIGVIIEEHVGYFGKVLFLIFCLAALILVIGAFSSSSRRHSSQPRRWSPDPSSFSFSP